MYKTTFKKYDKEPTKCEFIIDKTYVQVFLKNSYTVLYKLIENTLLEDPIKIDKILIFDLSNYNLAKEKLNTYLLMS
jgi:hypothetical protein